MESAVYFVLTDDEKSERSESEKLGFGKTGRVGRRRSGESVRVALLAGDEAAAADGRRGRKSAKHCESANSGANSLCGCRPEAGRNTMRSEVQHRKEILETRGDAGVVLSGCPVCLGRTGGGLVVEALTNQLSAATR